MAPKFNPIIRRTRLVAGDIPPEVMLRVGTDLRNAVRDRIHRAQDVRDGPAPPLKQTMRPVWKLLKSGELAGTPILQRVLQQKHLYAYSYPHYKEMAGKKPIRDWDRTGRTLGSMQVLSAAKNKAVIGFDDAGAYRRKLLPPSQIAALNNQKWPQFGASPNDMKIAGASFLALAQPIKIVTNAA